MYAASILFLGLFSFMSALAVENIPLQTAIYQPHRVVDDLSVSKPTPAPNQNELRRRQDSQHTLLAAPDNICGYVNGSSG
jgi:hypothetical protein